MISRSEASTGKGIKRSGYPFAFVEGLSADQYSRSGPRFLFRAIKPGVWLRSGMPSFLSILDLWSSVAETGLRVQPSAHGRRVAALEQRVGSREAAPFELADDPGEGRARQVRRSLPEASRRPGRAASSNPAQKTLARWPKKSRRNCACRGVIRRPRAARRSARIQANEPESTSPWGPYPRDPWRPAAAQDAHFLYGAGPRRRQPIASRRPG
jgi:hypothetical protein